MEQFAICKRRAPFGSKKLPKIYSLTAFYEQDTSPKIYDLSDNSIAIANLSIAVWSSATG